MEPSFLVVLAIFFPVVLLIGTGLRIRSLTRLIRDDPGYRVDHILSAQFELPTTQGRACFRSHLTSSSQKMKTRVDNFLHILL
jgi:hypothetical protein